MKTVRRNQKRKARGSMFDLSDIPAGAIMASLSADIAASARMIKQGRELALAVHALAKRDERYATLVADLEAVLTEQREAAAKAAKPKAPAAET